MWHYLVVYDRLQGQIIRHRAFRASDQALEARFAAEREFRGQPDIEVVVLSARSLASLSRTHSRYFKNVPEIAKAALSLAGVGEA
jgi:acetolactate synthase regulatory subunit